MLAFWFTLLLSVAEAENTASPTVDTIMQSIESTQQWVYATQELSLTIEDGKKTKSYRMKTEMRREQEALYCHARFLSPQPVANTQVVWIDRHHQDDTMWLYLPALKRVTTLNDNNRSRAFMGSDFEFHDFLLMNIPQAHRLVQETDTQWMIESIPKQERDTIYSKWITTVEKKSKSPQQIQLFQGDTQIKELTVLSIDANGLPTKSLMRNLKTQSQTTIEIHSWDTKTEISLDHFSKEYLLSSTPAQ